MNGIKSNEELTEARRVGLRHLAQRPGGFHFADNRRERAVFAALVKIGLAVKSWNYGAWMFHITDAGRAALNLSEETK